VKRYICIHGHFYQPPRENPWLETIELQDSAYPYHDWNERINAECYAQNAASRILDDEKKILRIVNNYSRISFNIGPTLLSWMEAASPSTYQAVLEADIQSRGRFRGHGSAMAQVYNHMILPLANRRDRKTQIAWGIRDFQRRFGRRPEGMWLAEAAVDLESLDLMAEAGLLFTVLSPHSARRVRKIGAAEWRSVDGGTIDPSRAYVQILPSGRSLPIFFYDGPVSRAVAFEGLLNDGRGFAARLSEGFDEGRGRAQLVHIATDGESYGHHHRQGDMALAYAIDHIEKSGLAEMTVYGDFLEQHPPTHEVEIVENSSWSCSHGIERWRSDCGCNSGGHGDWNQGWRAPLREALDGLRDAIAPLYDAQASGLFMDPWAARDAYIDVILDRSRENVHAFLDNHASGDRGGDSATRRLKLMELQRHLMLMYTSCGWFFDELSGIETVQVIQYAGRAVQLASEVLGRDFEAPFLEKLGAAKSNLEEHGDGRRIYEKWVIPASVDLVKVGAHYALSSLFEEYPDRARVYCYDADRVSQRTHAAGRMKIRVGRSTVTSRITLESTLISYAALHFGDHNIAGGVRLFLGADSFAQLSDEIADAFARADIPEVVRILDRQFGESTFSLRSLFRDEQRKLIHILLKENLEDADNRYRRIYESNAPVMRFLAGMGLTMPAALQMTAERALNVQLQRAFESPKFEDEKVKRLLTEAKEQGVRLDSTTLEYTFRRMIERIASGLAKEPRNLEKLRELEAAVSIENILPFAVNLWEVQNVYYRLMRADLASARVRAARGDGESVEWVRRFTGLGRALRVRVD